MTQSVADIPIHNSQRKAAIATGAVRDHAQSVTVSQLAHFDLDQTIFNTLKGRIPRFVMRTRIAKEVTWGQERIDEIEAIYHEVSSSKSLPEIDPALLKFMVEECDFDVEHADGSFLDHLYFCYEYTHHHMPNRSALVMLLHSILGTGTNTFAMNAEKIPQLQPLVNEQEWLHIESFPSVLRLLYAGQLRVDLWENRARLDQLREICFHRVIDNQLITMPATQFWVQLNYQLIHLVDFLPVSNWRVHSNDTSFIVFRDLYELLSQVERLEANIEYVPAQHRGVVGERQGLGARLISLIPDSLSELMAKKSIQQFSDQIGHSLSFELKWDA